MKKHRLFWLFLFLPFMNSFAQDGGTYAFLRNDVGARASGLNGSFVSMTGDPDAIFYNPATLSTISSPRVSVGYLKHLLDVNAGSASFAQNVEGMGNVGVGITFIDYGSFTETDQSLNTLGTFGATELAVVGGYGMTVDDRLSVGANAKFIYSSISDFHSTALALDLGVLYQIPSENIVIGGSILTLGRQLSTYAGLRESLPLDVKVGITKKPEHLPVYLNLVFHKLNEPRDQFFDRFRTFTFGAEFLMSESIRFRVGYNNEQRSGLKLGTSAGLAGFSVGGGVLIKEYRIDYAFNSYGTAIGGLHRVSVGMSL
jgi:hypothetical protein